MPGSTASLPGCSHKPPQQFPHRNQTALPDPLNLCWFSSGPKPARPKISSITSGPPDPRLRSKGLALERLRTSESPRRGQSHYHFQHLGRRRSTRQCPQFLDLAPGRHRAAPREFTIRSPRPRRSELFRFLQAHRKSLMRAWKPLAQDGSFPVANAMWIMKSRPQMDGEFVGKARGSAEWPI